MSINNAGTAKGLFVEVFLVMFYFLLRLAIVDYYIVKIIKKKLLRLGETAESAEEVNFRVKDHQQKKVHGIKSVQIFCQDASTKLNK